MNSDTNSNGASNEFKRNRGKRWGRGGGGYRDSPSAGGGKGQWSRKQSSGYQRSNNLVGAEGKYIPLGSKTAPTIDTFHQHWRQYISLSEHEVGNFSQDKLQAALTYLKSREVVETTNELFNFKRFFLNYNDIKESEILKEIWPSIVEELDGNAELIMGIFGLARYELWAEELGTRRRLPFIR